MTNTFVKSPIFSNWLSLNKPNKSLLICSPYFKKDAFEKIIECFGINEDSNNIEIDVLIRGRLEDFIRGSSDISALESLIRLKSVNVDKVRRLTNLHMKSYLIDKKKLLIGSGNCTHSGLFAKPNSGNVEGAIATTDLTLINDFMNYYSNILLFSESLNNFYDEISNGYDKYIDEYQPNIGSEILGLVSKSENKFKYKFRYMDIQPENVLDSYNISVDAIPQFSDFDDGCYRVVEILINQGDPGLTFVELGRFLEGSGKLDGAYRKYGENHSKLAELLDFVTITNTIPRRVYLTKLGKSFHYSNPKRKTEIIKSQIFRMDIVKDIIMKHSDHKFNLLDYLRVYLTDTTAKRRSPNVKKLFLFLKENGINEIEPVLEKL